MGHHDEWEILRGHESTQRAPYPSGNPSGAGIGTAPETPYVKPLPTGSRAKRARCASYGSGTQDLPTAA